MPNPICHFEIGCKDRAKAEKFYSDLFDWKIEQKEGQAMLRTGTDIGGHISALGHELHNYTIFYVKVDDVAAHLKKTEALGGKKIVGPIDIPGGAFAWISDPEGNTVGLYQDKK